MVDKPILSKQAFWGVDMDSIDYNMDALFVMESVINNSSLEDFFSIRKFYGDQKISKTVISAKELGPKEVNFCCHVLKLNPQDFIYPIEKHSTAQSEQY
jgi:hypothetical protein